MEYKIEADINKIEEYLKTIIIKQAIMEIGDIYPFYFIKDVEIIINSLNNQYSIWYKKPQIYLKIFKSDYAFK